MKREKEPILSGKLQPWRNPRPAPNCQRFRRACGRRECRLVRAWWPSCYGVLHLHDVDRHVFLGATGSVLRPILLWLVPSLTASQFELIHHLIRKCAHFTEYFIFACCFIAACVATARVALDVGPRGTLLCRWILGPG